MAFQRDVYYTSPQPVKPTSPTSVRTSAILGQPLHTFEVSVIGTMLGHYRIESKLGDGGMGVVYRALDTHLERPVALKLLALGTEVDPARRARFVQEARAASALNHPNIVTIHDIATADGSDYIAMEYLEGETLDQVLARGALPIARLRDYAAQIASAVARAHAAGIVHRDL